MELPSRGKRQAVNKEISETYSMTESDFLKRENSRKWAKGAQQWEQSCKLRHGGFEGPEEQMTFAWRPGGE